MRPLIHWLENQAGRLLLRPLLSVLVGFALFGSAAAAPPTLVAQPGVTAPASIAELARALKYDVNLIFEYVYTNIEYSPTYGLKKGALGTLLDGVGNDFDQSALLVALLRQSGYTATYQYGQFRLYPADIAAFYSVDVSDACPLANLLTNGGIPANITVIGPPPVDCTYPIDYADITHVWVSATGGSLGATTVALDPSYKTYTSATGMNLTTATGYNQSAFLTAAKSGASYTPGLSIQNVNSANIVSLLTGYANSLVAYIRANNPTATPRDVLGGKYIKPLTQLYTLPSTLPNQTPGTTPTPYPGDLDNTYRTTLRVKIGGIDKTYFGDAIYGHRLSIVYNASAQPVLYLDGAIEATGTVGANTISYTVSFPFCFATSGTPNPACPTPGSTNIFAFQNVVQAASGYTYAIVNGWDATGRGMVDFHRRQLQVNKAAGSTDSSEPVLGEALNMIGYSWLAQLAAASTITDRIVGSKVVLHCLVGVVGQVTGPYIDMPGGFAGNSSLTNDSNRANTAGFADGGALSALEWGALDQNLTKAGVGAVSTIKLLDLANSQGDVIFDATSANYAGSVLPQLVGYSTTDKAEIQNYINNNYRLVLPKHGNLTQGAWSGAGYIGIGPVGTGGQRELTYKISANLKGGYSDATSSPNTYVLYVENSAPYIPPIPQVTSWDPIDLSSGAFLYDHDDLSIGPADFPVGLGFRRSYNSNNAFTKGPVGFGWTHGFAINTSTNSDGLKGMAQDSPIDGAAAIAAAYVIQDLFSDATKPFDKVVIASLVQKWAMDQLINNTVNVTTGAQTEQFTLLADGTYNPPLGSSNRLTLNSGAYTLKTKDGTTLAFDAAGNISSWRSPANGTVSFAYDASTPPLLTSVSNGFGRSMTLGYNGSKQLTSVSDNSSPARSVNYTYDDVGNLASFRDPLGNPTAFAYAAPGLLSQVFYPSNPTTPFVTNVYDSLGRVATQTNANGATWNYFFAGYRSEEDDPYGTQHVIYYNPRGKAQFDIQDAAGSSLTTSFLYDGLDRLSSTTLPEKGVISYTYATSPNAWANNVASMVRTPKPLSPLSPLITSYTYDASFNKPLTVTDPRGLVTTMAYDSQTGNLLSSIADSGGLKATTRYTYDAAGLPLTVTDPVGTVTQFAYDASGNRTSTIADAGTGRLNQTTTAAYDSRGDPVSVTDPRGNVTTATYDDARRQIAATAPPPQPGLTVLAVTTTTTYDPDNRPIQVEQSANGSVLRTTSTTYTASGKAATATDANGYVSRYTYDLVDRLATATDGMGRTSQFTYTSLGQPFRTFNPAISASALLTQAWTADGQRASLADANGNTTTFAYDGFDRLATTTYPDLTTEAYTYDTDSNVLTRKTRVVPAQIISFSYDGLNRLITKTPPTGPVVSYTYDLAGRMRSASDTSSPIPSAVSPTGSPIAYTTNFVYDALNRPTETNWDQVNTAAAPSTTSSVLFTHGYNKANQRTAQDASDNAWINYPAAAASTTTYVPNTLNQYTSVGGVPQAYDTNGNLTGDGTYTYGYDPEGRLVSASGAGTSGIYTFDAQGSRKTVTTGGATTVFVTDADDREVLEYDGTSGAILRWHAYGLGPNAVLSQMNIPGNIRTTPVPGLLGSIVASLDTGSGALTKFAYRPFGASASPATPFGFTGQRFDQESGLYYFRARHYSSAFGRFLQPDPIGYEGGINLYAYVDNDPLNLIDPYGLKVLDNVQLGLTGLSFCPSVCGSAFSLLDAGISAARGNYTGAAISAGAAAAGVFFDAGAIKTGAMAAISAADAAKTANFANKGVGAAEVVAAQPNRIYSARVLVREAMESGPFHNFPQSFNRQIFEQGTRQATPNYFNVAKPGLSKDAIMYRLEGSINGTSGIFEIGARPSISGNTEVIIHRFFRPNP